MATMKFLIADEHSQGFKALAKSRGSTPSKLMRQMVEKVLEVNPAPVSPVDPAKRGRKRKVDVRLPASLFDEVEALAASEKRSLPSWIVTLVGATLGRCLPFNDKELDTLRSTTEQLARVGRNLNTLVHHIHRSGRGDASEVRVEELRAAVRDAAYQVMAVRDRALGRFGQGVDES
ncbi:MAG: hypothetical protein JSR34_08875 [Proteobacteria bacterium]|nr:hypothetical protein [Pseudomonadota bacterium]